MREGAGREGAAAYSCLSWSERWPANVAHTNTGAPHARARARAHTHTVAPPPPPHAHRCTTRTRTCTHAQMHHHHHRHSPATLVSMSFTSCGVSGLSAACMGRRDAGADVLCWGGRGERRGRGRGRPTRQPTPSATRAHRAPPKHSARIQCGPPKTTLSSCLRRDLYCWLLPWGSSHCAATSRPYSS